MLLAIIYQFCLFCFHALPAITAAWGVVLLLTGYTWGCVPRLRFEAVLYRNVIVVKGEYVL